MALKKNSKNLAQTLLKKTSVSLALKKLALTLLKKKLA